MSEKQAEKLALPILGIVFGGLGLLLSWVPIVNNCAFVLAIIALILTGISFLVNKSGKKTLTWISLGLSIATGAMVLMTQASYSNALDEFSSSINSETDESKKKIEGSIGETLDINGVKYTVNKVDYPEGSEFNKADDGKQWVVANITIKNESGETKSYNALDYELDANGNVTDFDQFNSDVTNKLDSGSIKDGASVTGNIVGQADSSKKLNLEYNGDSYNDGPEFSISLN